MAVTQLRRFTSYDIGSQQLTGLTGSLIAVIDSILVDGYGTGSSYVAPAGWTKPFGNTGSIGCWQQPSGSNCIMVINDAAPHPSAGTREAWVVGYETLTNLSGTLGTGSNAFPGIFYYGNTRMLSGSGVIRKSSALSSDGRTWIAFADDRTFYLFINPGDLANTYNPTFFGDIYSFAGPNDTKKCCFQTHASINNGTGGTTNGEWGDMQVLVNSGANEGGYICRTHDQRAIPVPLNRLADSKFAASFSGAQSALPTQIATTYHVTTNDLVISPVLVNECYFGNSWTNNSTCRGRMRGMYAFNQTHANQDDGTIYDGQKEYAGRKFQLLKGGQNGGIWLIEISNTVEYN